MQRLNHSHTNLWAYVFSCLRRNERDAYALSTVDSLMLNIDAARALKEAGR